MSTSRNPGAQAAVEPSAFEEAAFGGQPGGAQHGVRFGDCNLAAIRQAARHVTAFYEQLFAPVGLRATQYAILSHLRRSGPMTINALAAALVMDRTTLGRNILPLQRDGLIEVVASPADRRRHELRLTETGIARQKAASGCWAQAQQRFEEAFGEERAVTLRSLLREVVGTEFGVSG